MHAIFLVAFLLACTVVPSPAQSNPDSAFVLSAKSTLQKLYSRETLQQSAVFNGREYVEPRRTNDTHPFFENEDWSPGTVDYNGYHYEEVPLLYDINSDKVITEMFYNTIPIVLVPQFLTSFSLRGHQFIRIRTETVNNTLPKTGYYEVLYDGESKVIARHEKRIQERVETNHVEIDFQERTRLFIYHNGSYHTIRNKAAALKVWEDHKQALKQFAAKNKLKFRKQRIRTLTMLAEHYDTLNATK